MRVLINSVQEYVEIPREIFYTCARYDPGLLLMKKIKRNLEDALCLVPAIILFQ